MKRALRNLSKLAPLTPRIPAPTPVSRPTVVPDTRVESVLFGLMMGERARADFFEAKYRAESRKFTAYRSKGIARGIAKQMTPNHNPVTR